MLQCYANGVSATQKRLSLGSWGPTSSVTSPSPLWLLTPSRLCPDKGPACWSVSGWSFESSAPWGWCRSARLCRCRTLPLLLFRLSRQSLLTARRQSLQAAPTKNVECIFVSDKHPKMSYLYPFYLKHTLWLLMLWTWECIAHFKIYLNHIPALYHLKQYKSCW